MYLYLYAYIHARYLCVLLECGLCFNMYLYMYTVHACTYLPRSMTTPVSVPLATLERIVWTRCLALASPTLVEMECSAWSSCQRVTTASPVNLVRVLRPYLKYRLRCYDQLAIMLLCSSRSLPSLT